MYEDLQNIANAMKAAARYDDPDFARTMGSIGQALAACAEKTDAALRGTGDDAQRNRLRTIYRGMLAARRAAARLADTAGQ